MNTFRKYVFIIASLLLVMTSCREDVLDVVTVYNMFVNHTGRNLRISGNAEDIYGCIFTDSLYNEIFAGDDENSIYCSISTDINGRYQPLTDAEYYEYFLNFKIYYLEEGDTIRLKKNLYDGKNPFWEVDTHRAVSGKLFGQLYWWSDYTVTITDDMFEK